MKNKNVLLGITGGIAAYKTPDLVRRLRERGAVVRVVMTEAAQQFVTPLSLQALSGGSVHTKWLTAESEAAMNHIELARWADVVLIAPASAQCIAQLAHGFANDLLTTLCLATTVPLVIAPAMNQQMYLHKATQANLNLLKKRNVKILGPASGEQACGEFGPGRMLEPAEIASLVAADNKLLSGVDVLVTAGPTREALDPARFFSNPSSGKMGFALAEAAYSCGANVTLVAGPTHLTALSGIHRIDVVTAQQMYEAVQRNLASKKLFIACAAVADYRPEFYSAHKIKKSEQDMHIKLVRNPDILAAVANMDNAPFTVGFAAETENVISHAKAKQTAKSVDLMVANKISDEEGFASDENTVTILKRDGRVTTIEKSNKSLIAGKIISIIAEEIAERVCDDS